MNRRQTLKQKRLSNKRDINNTIFKNLSKRLTIDKKSIVWGSGYISYSNEYSDVRFKVKEMPYLALGACVREESGVRKMYFFIDFEDLIEKLSHTTAFLSLEIDKRKDRFSWESKLLYMILSLEEISKNPERAYYIFNTYELDITVMNKFTDEMDYLAREIWSIRAEKEDEEVERNIHDSRILLLSCREILKNMDGLIGLGLIDENLDEGYMCYPRYEPVFVFSEGAEDVEYKTTLLSEAIIELNEELALSQSKVNPYPKKTFVFKESPSDKYKSSIRKLKKKENITYYFD